MDQFNNPIKLIHKYKNKQKKIQYHIHIYIGPISKDILNILKKIEKLSLYKSWISLSLKDTKQLEVHYTNKWYTKFFNYYHINNTIALIRENRVQKKELIDKYGMEWYKEHIDVPLIGTRRIIYNYSTKIRNENEKLISKKLRNVQTISQLEAEDETNLNYKTTRDVELSNIFKFTYHKNKVIQNPATPLIEPETSEINIKNDFNSDNVFTGGNKLDDIYYPVEKNRLIKYDDDIIQTYITDLYNKKTNIRKPMKGGEDDYYENDTIIDSEVAEITNEPEDDLEPYQLENTKIESAEQYDEEKEEREDIIDENAPITNQEEEIDMEEIERMYKETDVIEDKNVTQTSKMIEQALDDKNIIEKNINSISNFDTNNDDSIYDATLENTYNKYYITTIYIFSDDSIKTIKNKICCSIKNNQDIYKSPYILPSRQYLWGEYYYENKIEKIMIGQKWLRRTELLDIDIEPNNNLYIYEDLRGNLELLKDNLKRYGLKIKRDDNDNYILNDYSTYMNDEIYMIDIYNELGYKYNPSSEIEKNLVDLYLKLYFPAIKSDDFKHILDYLNNNQKIEDNKIMTDFKTIMNDITMEMEIMYLVTGITKTKMYNNIIKENYITQSSIYVNLKLPNINMKIDLYKIFNDFILNDKYPFIQYQTPDNKIIFKFKESEIYEYNRDNENNDILMKWFENTPYGINFKIKIKVKETNKYKFMGITLNENGRIDYKSRWKEEDKATINDVIDTYLYVNDLIRTINHIYRHTEIQFKIPDVADYKFAFINTILKFELPDKFIINHNDLSDFSRNFYPYIALVIEPRKRQANITKGKITSKFGTYLRYKRISEYDNQNKIEQRLLYFMRNYEYNDTLLINEISKEFNITESRAADEIELVKNKYKNIKKSRRVLKKLENLPKYKPPGIGIDIQGKQRENYKIRISGARDNDQMNKIISFMKTLMYLYVETYLLKKKNRQILKETLKKLFTIAKRRNKVEEIVNYDLDINKIKNITALDKQRIGFKPEKGQNTWTRSCQNSGNDKKRRPEVFNSISIDKLLKKGYKYNTKTDQYEKKVSLNLNKGHKKDIILTTIKLQEKDEDGNPTGNEIYYTCDPVENGEHMYVGFLTKSNNPSGLCMPCCFKKNPAETLNKQKKDFIMKCLGQKEEKKTSSDEQEKLSVKLQLEKLYILQDTNKIQYGRFGFLPNYIDFFFNKLLNKKKTIKHHYLVKTDTGYFFKYGIDQTHYPFLSAMSSLLNLSITEIKNKIIDTLNNDKTDVIFTSLNNGDIKTQFVTRENYIEFIKYNNFLDFDIINNIISIPGTFFKDGMNIIVFYKKIISIKKTFEKIINIEDFFISCQDIEDKYRLEDEKRENFFILKENKYYYPIVMVHKKHEISKNIDIIKSFKYESNNDNIIKHIKPYYDKNCHESLITSIIHKNSFLNAKNTYYILNKFQIKIKYQNIDIRNKCRYLITNTDLIIPIRPSGSLYNVPIIKFIDKFIQSFDKTLNDMKNLFEISKGDIPIKPIGVYYDNNNNNNKITINGIMTITKDIIPIIEIEKDINDIKKLGLIYENRSINDKIDMEISKGKDNYVIDKRIMEVNTDYFTNESYELFRLTFSKFINNVDNIDIKNNIESIIKSNSSYQDKIIKIRLILYKLIDIDLYKIYKELILENDKYDTIIKETVRNDEINNKKYKKFIQIIPKIPDVSKYQLNNNRVICDSHNENCTNNIHCTKNCHLGITNEMAVNFINKISDELVINELKSSEILHLNKYYVSEIIDPNKFTERKDQKIVTSSNITIKKVLNELFGKDNLPKVGKRKGIKVSDVDYQELNIMYPLKKIKNYYSQQIINNNLTIFRAYSNAYYWLKNQFYDNFTRNIGYYSTIQTELSYYFKSIIIDWLNDSKNEFIIKQHIYKYLDQTKTIKENINDIINKLSNDIYITTNSIIELFILNQLHDIPIVVYDNDDNVIYMFDKKIILNSENNMDFIIENRKNYINIKFNFITQINIPDKIEVIYYE